MRTHATPSRIIALVLVASLTAPLIAPPVATAAPAVTASTTSPESLAPNYTRLTASGASGSSVAASKAGWSKSAVVVIASSSSSLDQLVAAPLAGAYDAPLLLSDKSSLSSAVRKEVRRLGAKTAYVVGDRKRVPASVLMALKKSGVKTTKRLGSSSYYTTSRLVAGQIRVKKGAVKAVVIAHYRYPTWCASAIPLAMRYGMPILLTNSTGLHSEAKRVLTARRPSQVLIVGGTTKVPAVQASAIASAAAIGMDQVRRIDGTTVYEISAGLAEFAFASGLSYANVTLANDKQLGDLYVAAVLAGRKGGAALTGTATSIPQPIFDFVQEHCSSIERMWLIGSKSSLPDLQLADLKKAGETLFKENVKVVEAPLGSKLVTMSPDRTVLYFSADADLSGVKTGDIIASRPVVAAPNGFLRQVLSVSSPSTYRTAEALFSVVTTAATLGDVVQKGSFDVRTGVPEEPSGERTYIRLESANAVDDNHVDISFAEMPTDKGSDVTSAAIATTVTSAGRREDVAWPIHDPFSSVHESAGGYNVPLGIPFYMSADKKIYTEGYSSGRVDIVANGSWGITSWATVRKSFPCVVGWKWGVWPIWGTCWYEARVPTGYGLTSAEFTTYFTQTVDVRINIRGTFSNMSFKHELVRIPLGYLPFMIGPVPAWISFGGTPTLGVEADVTGDMYSRVIQSSRSYCGFRHDYRYGDWGVSGNTSSLNWEVPVAISYGRSRGYFGLRFDCMLYDFIGPYSEPQVFLESFTDPVSQYRVYAGVSCAWGGQLTFFGKVKSWEFIRRDLTRRQLLPQTVVMRSLADDTVEPLRQVASASEPVWRASSETTAGAAKPVKLDGTTVQASDFTIPGLTVTGAELLADGTTVRLTTTTMARGRSYTVQVEEGSLTDTAGSNVLASLATFATQGNEPLTTILSAPTPNGLNGWFTTPPSITLTPSRAATPSYAWAQLGETTPAVFTLGSSTTASEGEHRIFYRSVDAEGYTGETRSEVFRVDSQAPVAVTLQPADGATGVRTPVNVTVSFSEAIDPVAASGAIRLDRIDGTTFVPTPGVATYDANARTLTFTPDAPLWKGRQYRVSLSGIRDVAGNAMMNVVWYFRTVPGFE